MVPEVNLGNTTNLVCGETEKSVYNSLQHPSSGNRNDTIEHIDILRIIKRIILSEYPVKGRGSQSSGSISVG